MRTFPTEFLRICYTSFLRHFYFIVAALSLLLTGVIFPGNIGQSTITFLLIIWGCISGILIVYRYNDFADKTQSPWLNTLYFFRDKFNLLLVVQFFAIGIPLSAIHLSSFQFITMAIAGITGIFYAVNFRVGSFSWMVKFVPAVKNLLIGIAWALLFAVGNGHLSTPESIAFFLLIALQVFIGSSIRDIADIVSDQKKGLHTIATAFGEKKVLLLLQLLNLFGLIVAFLFLDILILVATVSSVTLYRAINLWMIHLKGSTSKWTQHYNLATCFLIFVVTLIVTYATT
jgi:4-hydroxybenzoate polyprenyltransferase